MCYKWFSISLVMQLILWEITFKAAEDIKEMLEKNCW